MHKADYDQQLDKLKKYESNLRQQLVFDIQAWWGTTLAWRKAKRHHDKFQFSAFKYRVRRLVKLKKALDKFDPAKKTFNELEDEFCDLIPELREYRLYKKSRVMNIVARWGTKALSRARKKLSNILEKVCTWHLLYCALLLLTIFSQEQRLERLRQEALLERRLRRENEMKIAEDIRQDLHALAEEMAKRDWTCPRFECKRRKFLSKERYETHMRVHCMMDVEVEKARREVYMRKMQRLNEEEDVRAFLDC